MAFFCYSLFNVVMKYGAVMSVVLYILFSLHTYIVVSLVIADLVKSASIMTSSLRHQ